MSDMQVEQRSALQKVRVECRTCGLSESFYSNLSVDKFKARHSGHDVVTGNPRVNKFEAKQSDNVVGGNDEMAPPPAVPEAMPAPKETEPLKSETGVKVAKVLVDVLNFPSLGGPMIRVRGFDVFLEEAFTATLLLEQGAKVREMLESGKYLDIDASRLLYVWEPDVVEYVEDAKTKLETLGQSPTEAASSEPAPDSRESEVVDETVVSSAAEVVIDAVGEVEPSQVGAEPLPEAPFSAPTLQEEFEVPALPSPPQPAQEPSLEVEQVEPSPPQPAQEPSLEVEQVEPSPPSQMVQPKATARTAVDSTSESAISPLQEAKEDSYLLVSNSWYIQGGTGNRNEALRISKVLKAFRWKIEPVYTIGVILDDMLSIETSRGEISRTIISRIESMGYKLTAVVTEKGKPVAWFKKEGSGRAAFRGEAGSGQAGGPGSDETEMELEPDVTG